MAAPTLEVLGSELAVSATFGLALSGKPEAEGVIQGLMAGAATLAPVKAAAVEAAEIARTMRAHGQKEYYRTKCTGKRYP